MEQALAANDDPNEWAMREFERCAPFIQRAINRTNGETALEHVREEVKAGHAQIWPLPNACIITKISTFRTGLKVLHLWLAGGDKRQLLKAYEAYIEPWAKEKGCARMTISGRPGWLRAMKTMGVEQIYVVMGKSL